MASVIKKETIVFLKDLKKNNNRDWFNTHKERFVAANENFIEVVQELLAELARFDKSVAGLEAKKCVFRIYKDTRFSKDKSPYKTNFGALLMAKEKMHGIAGYYFHLEPGASFLAGGIHLPEPKELKLIRDEISYNSKSFLKIINDKNFKQYFTIEGEKLVKVPAGFEKDDPMGDFLKYKEMVLMHYMDDKQITDTGFTKYCAKVYKAMLPFNQFMNEPLMNK